MSLRFVISENETPHSWPISSLLGVRTGVFILKLGGRAWRSLHRWLKCRCRRCLAVFSIILLKERAFRKVSLSCRQDNGRLSTKVYRKPTHTERYLSFHSHHPVAHKRAVVKSLIDRAKIIPSSSEQRSKEMKHVTAALVANGFPKRFVIDVGKPKRLAQQLSTTAPDAAKGFCILPYIKGTSEPIKRILSNHNIKVAQKPHQTIGNLFPKP